LILRFKNSLKFFWQCLSFFSLLQIYIYIFYVFGLFFKKQYAETMSGCDAKPKKFSNFSVLQKNIFSMFLYYFWNSLFKKHILRLCLVERRDSRNWNIFYFLLYFKLIFVWYFFLNFKLIRSCLILHFKNSLKKIWEFWSFFFLYFKWFFFMFLYFVF
jgi:hypothetical protein